MITWTIGAGGLLGSAITRQSTRPFAGSAIPWGQDSATSHAWEDDVRRFRNEAGSSEWAVIWAAGAAMVASSSESTEAELATLTALLKTLRTQVPTGRGAVFLTSSAGGVYAGSANPPFTSATEPVPVSAYGELKIRQENAVRDMLTGVCPVVIGRVGNLYGPGQNLNKLQGLISRLAVTAATQEPLNIFVPLDTIRDYIYVDDAAAIALADIADAVDAQSDESRVHVIASGDAVTVGQLITTTRLVTKRRVPIALGSHTSARSQVLDLRLVPSGAAADHSAPSTPLPVGVKSVYLDILDRIKYLEASHA